VTWVSWRQFRPHAIVAAVALAAVAVVLLITGVHLAHLYSTYKTEARTCGVSCDSLRSQFLGNYRHVRLIGSLLIGVPVIIGLFWGAPLVARELENGTYRLAWTQGVTRTRWLATKLAVVGVASAAAAGLYSLAVSWWGAPLDAVNANRITPPLFDQRGIVPIGYALFAFALGVTAGLIFKRTLPAMATTIVGFITTRMLTQYLLRPHLMAPAHGSYPLSAARGIGFEYNGASHALAVVADSPDLSGAWVTHTAVVDAAGRAPSKAFLAQACPHIAQGPPLNAKGGHVEAPAAAQQQFSECLHQLSARFHEVVTYQPASRFWGLQGLETAVFVALAALLLASCFVLVHRRVS
jgi:hypothetical protein